jgi:transposase-like protein
MIHCNSENVVKMDKQSNGTPQYKYNNYKKTFQSQYTNKGTLPQTKLLIVKMTTNDSGI